MKRTLGQLLFPLLSASVIAACGGQTTHDGLDAPAEPITRAQDLKADDLALLGQAYDSQKQALFFRSCVTGTTIRQGNTRGVLTATREMGFEEVLDQVSGALDVGIQLPVVKAGAGASIANQHASTSLAETQHLVWISTNKSEALDLGSVEVSPTGQRLIDTRPDLLEQRCGDEFIVEIRHGVSFLATLKVEFLNEDDRRSLQGKLKINLTSGLIDVDGNLSSVDQAKLQRTNLSVLVTQNGGHPERLLRILPSGLMSCTLDNRAPCLAVFENLIQYANTEFSAQAADPEQQNVIGYATRRYEDSQADALVPAQGYTLVKLAVTNKLNEVERLLRQAMADELRANNLLASGGFAFTSPERNRLREIAALASENVITYAEISRFCYAHMNEDCLTHARERQGNPLAASEAERAGSVHAYDPAELDIEIPDAPAPKNACSGVADGLPCDDGLFCTDASVCRAGVCSGTRAHACGSFRVCDEALDTCNCAACQEADGSCSLGHVWYRDRDGDGFGDPLDSVTACSAPAGYIAGPPSDCCDLDSNAKPGQTGFFKTQNACHGWDYDCNSVTSFQMSCAAGSSGCGCLAGNSCTVGNCGTDQNITTCQTTGPYSQITCSVARREALACR